MVFSEKKNTNKNQKTHKKQIKIKKHTQKKKVFFFINFDKKV